MSHSAASIKSIFSGRVNLTDTEFDDSSTTKNSYGESRTEYLEADYPERILVDIGNYDSESIIGQESEPSMRNDFMPTKPPFRDPRDLRDRDADSFSVSSKNLRIMALQRGTGDLYDPRSSSTNVSLASSGSDYQQSFIPDQDAYLLEASQNDGGIGEISRPASRNSTTSCLLTTATKDGVEGKKLHRHGPTPYSSSVIADMISHQQHPILRPTGDVSRFQKQDAELPMEEKNEVVGE